MHVVLLKFSNNRAQAGEHMPGHKAWLQQGFDEGFFVAAGSLHGGQGGCLFVQELDTARLTQRLAEDPFVAHDVVQVEIVDVALNKADPRLSFLLASPA